MIILPDEGIMYVRVLLGAVLVAMYTYNVRNAFVEWHRHRAWDTFRQFIMAFELFFGISLILTGYINAAFFLGNTFMTDLLRTLGYLLLGVLLVGGVTLVVSWRKPGGY